MDQIVNLEIGNTTGNPPMPHGHITRLVPEHDFGFLEDDAGLDWFFRRKDIRGGDFASIWLNERVIFVPESSPGGPRATDIHFERAD